MGDHPVGERDALAIAAPERHRSVSALADRNKRVIRGCAPHVVLVAPRAHRRAVLDAAGQLDSMMALLRAPGAVAAAGVARVVLLLGDGLGPLYIADASPGLPAAVAEAIAGLEAGGASG